MVGTFARALGIAAALAVGASGCGDQARVGAEDGRAKLSRAYGALPLSFEANRGQHDRDVEFAARGAGASVALTRRDAVIAVGDEQLRMRLAGARAQLVGERRLPGTANYLHGDDRRRWITGVPTFGRVRYRRAWPGIDVTFRGDPARGLEYDFEMAPGAEPDRIRIALDGNRGARIDARGDLLIRLGDGLVIARRPVAYQPRPDGARTPVASRHVIRADGSLGFEVGDRDPTRPLVIDPLIVYSTYLGGSEIDKALAVAVDANGNAYVTGQTSSTNFPKQGAFQGTIGGGADAFVTKINPAGNAIVYSTYVGGSGFDEGRGIAIDTLGRAHVTGRTSSSNFPAKAPGDTVLGGVQDAFVLRLNAAGTDTLFSTYHGGSDFDDGWAIAVDPSGGVYVAGDTDSTNFPAVAPRQSNQPGTDGFVSKLNSSGAVVYSTYHGGDGVDSARAIAADDLGNAYVTGITLSSNLPLASPLQTDATGGGEAFVSKFNPAGTALSYSTYLGGNDSDQGHGIAVDASRSAYVTGWTRSADFPKTGGAASGVKADVFVTKLAPSGGALAYSIFLGGADSSDEGRAIAVDASGRAHVAGFTFSRDFPLVGAFDTDRGGVYEEAFAAKLDANGSIRYSSYLGGTGYDIARGIGVDANGSAYVVGETGASDFPTVVALQAQRSSDPDAFVARIDGSDETAPETTIGSGPPGRTQDRGATFAFSSSEPAGATFECKVDSGSFAPCTSPAARTDLGEGEHTFQVRAIDASRNVDASPATFSWRVDLTAPVARLAVAPNPITAGEATAFDASASSDAAGTITRFQFDLDGDGAFETDSLGQPRASRTYAAAGDVAASVRVTDEVGLTGTAKVDLRVNPGPPAPAQQRVIRSVLDWKARYAGRLTRLTRLVVKRVPADGRVTVRCKATGRRCPFKQRTFKGLTVTLTSRFRGRRLRPGDTIDLRVTAPGAIGNRHLMRFRTGDLSLRTQCLTPAGAVRRCPAD